MIPTSAHGTNPASAHLANFRVCPVISDKHGNINYKDLSAKVRFLKEKFFQKNLIKWLKGYNDVMGIDMMKFNFLGITIFVKKFRRSSTRTSWAQS